MSDLLRVYLDPAEIGNDGYPKAWHDAIGDLLEAGRELAEHFSPGATERASALVADRPMAIKDYIRERDGHRCLRCHHPYQKGQHGNGEWSPCDEHCVHPGPIEALTINGWKEPPTDWWLATTIADMLDDGYEVRAQWRILTVHHLGEKYDCRWFMLVSLCQRCHLQVQAKVQMNRVWPWEHSDWFKPFAAAWYSWVYEDREISYEEAVERMDELLAHERMA